jgi:flagella basal body P-ring formation protein FlgA
MKTSIISLLSVITLAALPVWAGAVPASTNTVQSHAEIRDTVAAFARAQTLAIPGKATIQVADIDPRITLPACPALEAFLAAGVQLNGNSSVGVRCVKKHSWSMFVQVNVKISVNMLTLNKTLQQGQTLRDEDIGILSSESLQSGTLTDPAQAVGKIMKYGVGAGQILRHDMLRAPYTVKQGQSVSLQVLGSGFKVRTEGQALSNAAEGDTTTARTASGQIVSGVVKGGALEVSP